jgi:hypothetical protein
LTYTLSMQTLWITFWLSGISLLPAQALARPPEYRVNVREGCRQAIAGGYLKVYDEKERLRTYIRALDDQLKELKPLLQSARNADQAAAKAMEKSAFETEVAARRGEAAAHLRAVETQYKEAEVLKSQAQKEHQRYVAEEAALRAAILPVFSFERTEDKPDGGYPIHLSYKAGCPKYRHLCPLPAKDAADLIKIKIEGIVPEECQRYAGLSKLR